MSQIVIFLKKYVKMKDYAVCLHITI